MMKVQIQKASELRPHPQNPKRHTPGQIDHIRASIREFGWVQPIVVDESNTILVGHGRWEAAKDTEVPVLKVRNLSAQQKLTLMLFDNTSNLQTGFDAGLMEELIEVLKDAGFPLSEMGFLPEVLGESTGDRKVDENKLKESYDRYMNGEVKRLVLYFAPGEVEFINGRIDSLMEKDGLPMKSDLVKAMLLEYEREHGKL